MLEHVGPRWADDVPGHIARVVAGYTEVARLAPRAGYIVQRDVAYGPHARHRLDVFTPSGAVSGDVLVFVHGGAFVRGDKTVSEALYDNVCRWFARQGVIAVNVEYRLAGDAPFPGGSEDVGAAVHWLAQHVGTLGGDASRIFLMGHSAGGTHVASYCCEPLLADAFAQAPVAGAVLVSARLRADVLPDNPNAFAVRAYYGDDAQAHEAHSPVT
ncbi:MAG: alpha/beta hydrolase, partial [Variovorax sp.]